MRYFHFFRSNSNNASPNNNNTSTNNNRYLVEPYCLSSSLYEMVKIEQLILKYLKIVPLPTCRKHCPSCHNHCVTWRGLCNDPCKLVDENNVTIGIVCSLGCKKGLCPANSQSFKFYGKIIFTTQNRLKRN